MGRSSGLGIRNDIRLLPRIQSDFRIEPTTKQQVRSALSQLFADLWREVHTQKDPSQDWFASWVARVPGVGCDCKNWLKKYLASNPPRFDDWFAFTWELHNAVNAKLNRKQLTLEKAIRTWKPAPNKTESIEGCRIVTAFGPKRIERQQHCLETWLRSGFKVTALQATSELSDFKDLFRGVDWVEENARAIGYNFATQRIRRLIEEAKDEPILLLNSDCAMAYGDGLNRFKQHLAEGVPKFYVRWNHDETSIAAEFQWGLDGLLLWPEDVSAIPQDAPYGIGHAMWDYAVPIFLQQHGRGFSIDHYPWLMHLDHPQNWNEDSWQLGFNWLHLNGYEVDYDSMRNGRYRKSLDPGMMYLGSKWIAGGG
jgi:hypothetical protein